MATDPSSAHGQILPRADRGNATSSSAAVSRCPVQSSGALISNGQASCANIRSTATTGHRAANGSSRSDHRPEGLLNAQSNGVGLLAIVSTYSPIVIVFQDCRLR